MHCICSHEHIHKGPPSGNMMKWLRLGTCHIIICVRRQYCGDKTWWFERRPEKMRIENIICSFGRRQLSVSHALGSNMCLGWHIICGQLQAKHEYKTVPQYETKNKRKSEFRTMEILKWNYMVYVLLESSNNENNHLYVHYGAGKL